MLADIADAFQLSFSPFASRAWLAIFLLYAGFSSSYLIFLLDFRLPPRPLPLPMLSDDKFSPDFEIS